MARTVEKTEKPKQEEKKRVTRKKTNEERQAPVL
jgi:hypothetical protein